MRRMIMTSLILLPVMAHAQAGTSTEIKPSTFSAMNEAELTQPVISAELATTATAKNAVATAPAAASSASNHAVVREFVQTRVTDNFMDAALMKAGTLEYAMMGSAPTESSAPKVTRAVEVGLSEQELAEQPAVSNVVLHAIVDANGIPRNVGITKSGGALVDRKAIEAVSQYRFQPATLDNKPTWATVSVAIKIQKP